MRIEQGMTFVYDNIVNIVKTIVNAVFSEFGMTGSIMMCVCLILLMIVFFKNLLKNDEKSSEYKAKE